MNTLASVLLASALAGQAPASDDAPAPTPTPLPDEQSEPDAEAPVVDEGQAPSEPAPEPAPVEEPAPAAPEEPAIAPPPPAPVEAPAAPPTSEPPASAGIPGLTVPFGPFDVVVKPYVAYRPRAELVGDRTLSSDMFATVVTHRARLGATAAAGSMLSVRVELQDVRTWGAEVTPANLPPEPTAFGRVDGSVDLHQAYATLTLSPLFELRVGRQEINIGNQRIVSALDWAQTARSFDGARVMGKLGDTLSYTAAAAILTDNDVNPTFGDAWLVLGAIDVGAIPAHTLHASVFYDGNLLLERQRGTAAFWWKGAFMGFQYELESAIQASMKADGLRYAILAGARAGYTFDFFMHPGAGVVVDVLSGAPGGVDGPGLTTFDPFYGLNHAFYGYQDLFLNLPLHTKNQGLLDVAPRVSVEEGLFSARAFVHIFAPTSSTVPGIPLYGVEPDLVVGYAPLKGLKLEGGTSLFVPIGDALGRGDRVAPWVYFQCTGELGG